jgi:hypothetical protein
VLPVKHHLALCRINQELSIRCFYSLMIGHDPFGTMHQMGNWCGIGTKGQELVEIHADENAAGDVNL